MIVTILISVSVTLWCLFAFALYGYYYILEVILDLPIVGESPCSAHSALKRIIRKIIREANELPQLKNIDQNNSLNPENRTYEDLLSTAILNKIISSSQNVSLNSSRANSVCSHRSPSLRRRKLQKKYFFGENALNSKKNCRNDTDTASISSLEEWVLSDSSRGSTKYVDRLSFTIKQRIEEASSSESDADIEYEENNDAEYLNFKSPSEDENPNWFLKTKQFRGVSYSPVPVSMLVPDPSKEAKILIGDKEIDDTSDLSDVPSDFKERDDILPSIDMRNHLIDSKKLIGGKSLLADFYSSNFSDDEISADSGVKECKYIHEVDSELLSTSNKIESKFIADGSMSSDGSNTERDMEYTEKYGTFPKKISISPNNKESSEKPTSDKIRQYDNTDFKTDVKVENVDDNTPKFTGVYSKREKEKWSHAVELENNPYSKENIEKRIKHRSPINSIFGSDYYIRQASLPSGTKKTEEITPYSFEELDTFHNKKNQEQKISTNGVHENTPEKIQRNKLMARPFNITESPNQKSMKCYDLVMHSSDSEVSLVNCYDVNESVIYKKLAAENNEEIQTAEKYFDFESLENSPNPMEERGEDNIEHLVVEPIIQDDSIESVEVSYTVNEPELVNVEIKHERGESSNEAPYILTKRSDNTLIKKIYSDPSVRSFALSRRQKLPSTVEVIDFVNKPSLKYATSSELSRPLMLKQYSWDNRKAVEKSQNENEIMQSEKYKSKSITHLEKEPSTKYKTSPELTKSSTNMQYLSDNGKCRQNIPTETKSSIFSILTEENTPNQNQEIEIQFEARHRKIYPNSNKSNSEFEAFEEIDKLKTQKLVANRLKQFSKSTLDLSRNTDTELNKMITFTTIIKKEAIDFRNREDVEGHSELQGRVRSNSVRDLCKKFERFDADVKVEQPILHSLTGRSLSKQFKEKLRDADGDDIPLLQIHSLSLSNLEVEENMR